MIILTAQHFLDNWRWDVITVTGEIRSYRGWSIILTISASVCCHWSVPWCLPPSPRCGDSHSSEKVTGSGQKLTSGVTGWGVISVINYFLDQEIFLYISYCTRVNHLWSLLEICLILGNSNVFCPFNPPDVGCFQFEIRNN